ncbi:biopolymer transporter ExbD [uncultured Anaerobiospirillum sp.]|uniref:ExbD/TolR family protein n=1 Tax=uncultured Anaerobiospirillum sp. TaxID=265728 RepID=UPI0028056E00|nr:biopolymer transporter ExbD [uncultured Anaerobiospirillum sp.]
MNEHDDDLNVDLTPLIDVIFMLVIFFIMTMSFTLPVIDFNLPQSGTAQSESRTATIRVSVDAHGNFSAGETSCTVDELETIIEKRMVECNDNNEELSIELVISSDTPTQHLITVADLARTYTHGRLLVVAEKNDNAPGAPGSAVGTRASESTAPTNSSTTYSAGSK